MKQSRICIKECFVYDALTSKVESMFDVKKTLIFGIYVHLHISDNNPGSHIINIVIMLLSVQISAFSEVYVFHAYVLPVCPYVMYGSPILKIHKTIPRHEPIPINI